MAVEKTAELVQQTNVERQELITQLENSIGQMRKKDQDIQQCALVTSYTKTCLREINLYFKSKKII